MKNLDSAAGNSKANGQILVNTHQSPSNISLLKNPRRKGKTWLKITLSLILIAVLGLGSLVLWRAANLSGKVFVGKKTTFFQKIGELFGSQAGNVSVQGEKEGQINILLLGIGGEGHDGPYLTDTMIVAQIRPDIGQVVLTSIPRDYLVNLPQNYGQQKINSAFSYGFGKNKDWSEAGNWATQMAQNVSGLTIPYFAVIDFSGFEKAVDEVGGLDVTVDRTFTDYAYPDNGTGYLPPQTFTAGPAHMDGKRALIFARSRHAAGIEGSDFARSQRQQKIIQAFKSKLLSLNLVTDVARINTLLGVFADHFHTNISPGELYHIYNLIKQKNIQTFLPLSLDPATHLICDAILPDNGAYVLQPCPGKTTEDIQNFFKNAFDNGKLTVEHATIWVGNSTSDAALSKNAIKKLEDVGLTVVPIKFTKTNLQQTVVYQVNSEPSTTEFIKNTLSATEVRLAPPDLKIATSTVDVIVILGEPNKN